MILCVANQKGGAGKSTISMLLAAELASLGERVVIGDCDPQGSALSWAASAPVGKSFGPPVLNLSESGQTLPGRMRELVEFYDTIVLDCPPSVRTPMARAALLVSDLVLVPMIPSPPDFAAATQFLALVTQAQAANPALQARVVPSRVVRTRVAAGILSKFASLPIQRTNAAIYERAAYGEAALFGVSIRDVRRASAAISEIEALTVEVLQILSNPIKNQGAPSVSS